jgi:hypothetical protein
MDLLNRPTSHDGSVVARLEQELRTGYAHGNLAVENKPIALIEV